MMNQRFSRYGVLAFLVFGLACGGNDGPAGPGGGSSSNPVAVGFNALADGYAAVMEANAPTYASVATFGPLIIQSLHSPPPLGQQTKTASNTTQGSCLPTAMQDVVFVYDVMQGQYVPSSGTGAPAGGARYTLYEVDGNGAPVVPLVAAGSIDVNCSAGADTITTSIETAGGVSIMGMELYVLFASAPEYIITTSPTRLSSPDGTVTLDVLFSAQAQAPLYEMSTRLTVAGLERLDARAEGLQMHAGLDDPQLSDGLPAPPYSSFGVGATQSSESHSLEWNAGTTTSVAADGTLLSILQDPRAPLEYEDRQSNTNGVLACFSGNYRMPQVDSASSDGGCATGVIETPIPLSAGDLTAIQQGSVALTDILETLSNMLAVALPLIL